MGYKSSTSFSANLCDSINVTLLTNYTSGQKAALLKYATEPEEKTYLLFIVPGNAGNVAGFMPLNRSAGFIYINGQSSDQINQTIAHELGHGAFGLDHVGKAADDAAAPTDNLMDYSNSTALDKPQWDKMHSEYRRITWFQDASEGERRISLEEENTIWAIRFLSETKKTLNYNSQKKNKGYERVLPSLRELNPEKLGTLQSTSKISFDGIDYGEIYFYFPNIAEDFLPVISEIQPPYLFSGPWFKVGNIKISCSSDELTIKLREALLNCTKSNNILLFVNGYRLKPADDDYPDSNNLLGYGSDPYSYWSGIDNLFAQSIGTSNVVYADGHLDLTTSNHNVEGNILKSKAYFGASLGGAICATYGDYAVIASFCSGGVLSTALAACGACNHQPACVNLHTTPNKEGFMKRYNSGIIAGNNLLADITAGNIPIERDAKGTIIGKLDVVAHSMGYAYSLGMLSVLKGKIPFGRFYILAPENPSSGSVKDLGFDEIWQYGSHETENLWEQDGVAPQCAVKDIQEDHRIYITAPQFKGFVASHFIENYIWIFKLGTEPGYVKPRK